MWRNPVIAQLMHDLHALNRGRAADEMAGFYGLDIYNMSGSIEAVLAYPGMTPPSESDFTRLLHELTGAREPAKVAFGTDGGCFAARDIPTLICGPGDIKVAHKPDEWIAVEQLERCDALLREFVRRALVSI